MLRVSALADGADRAHGLRRVGRTRRPAATSAPAVAADEVFAAASRALTTQPLQFKMQMRGLFSVNGWMDVTARTAEVMGSLPVGGQEHGRPPARVGPTTCG